MPGVHVDAVLPHCLCNLVDYAVSGCLDAHALFDFENVVGEGVYLVYAFGHEDLAEAQALSVDYVAVGLFFLGDEGAMDCGDAADGDLDQPPPQGLEFEYQVGFGERH